MNGFLCIDKPSGISSNHALSQLKRKLNFKKIGHTGTLDPFATGLLVVGLGEALKVLQYLEGEPKVYEATLKLGSRTDTLDLDGEVIEIKEVPYLNSAEIERVLKGFEGEQDQTPPMFSAKKIQGQKLYELARQGLEIERKPCRVTVHQLELVRFTSQEITFKAAVSAGTYIRVLGECIAVALQTVGHLTALRRVQSGFFKVEEGLKPDGDWPVGAHIIPIRSALGHLPELSVDLAQKKRLLQGQPIASTTPTEQIIPLIFEGQIFGLGEYRAQAIWPKRMFN